MKLFITNIQQERIKIEFPFFRETLQMAKQTRIHLQLAQEKSDLEKIILQNITCSSTESFIFLSTILMSSRYRNSFVSVEEVILDKIVFSSLKRLGLSQRCARICPRHFPPTMSNTSPTTLIPCCLFVISILNN